VPRRRSATLTDAELRLMNVLWDGGAATVEEVIQRVDGEPKPAHNTVLTLLRILERKGYVSHGREGRAFRFRPLVDRSGARRTALQYLLNRFFEGSPGLLVQNVLEQERLSGEEIARLRRMIGSD
jgi:BlaI family transcriptional regulator, penicillinase repressor